MGEDLGGGSPDVQAPRTFESRTGSKKISGRFEEDLHGLIPHAVPVGRRIEEGCALVPPRQFIRTSGGSWRGLGGGLGRLGGVLGPLGGVLGALGGILARLGGFLGPLGGILAHLGAVLAYLGGILGHLGGVLEGKC